jgi:hypothetical protein
MDKIAEGLGDQDALPDGDLAALHLGLVDAPDGLAIAARGALEQLERRRRAPPERRIGGRIQRIAEQEPVSVSRSPGRTERRLVQLIEMVQHESALPSDFIL